MPDLNALSAALFSYVPWIDSNLDTILYNDLQYYPTLAGFFLFIGLILIALYYYPGGAMKARYSQFRHWLLWSLAVTGVINSLVVTLLIYREVEYEYPGDTGLDTYLILFGITVLTSFLYTTILSFLIRWRSVDGKSTPFPQ